MTMDKKIDIEDIRRLDIRKGDILVLRTRDKLSSEAIERMRATLDPILLPFGATVIVLVDGMTLDVVAKA